MVGRPAKALGMRPEQAELAIQNARKISKERLLDGLKGGCARADDRLKGGTKDPAFGDGIFGVAAEWGASGGEVGNWKIEIRVWKF